GCGCSCSSGCSRGSQPDGGQSPNSAFASAKKNSGSDPDFSWFSGSVPILSPILFTGVGTTLSRRRLATSRFVSPQIRKSRRELQSLDDSAGIASARECSPAATNCEVRRKRVGEVRFLFGPELAARVEKKRARSLDGHSGCS